MSAVHQNVTVGWVPGHHWINNTDLVYPDDAPMVTAGYGACRAFHQHPGDEHAAAIAFWKEYDLDVTDTMNSMYAYAPLNFMNLAHVYLCNPEG